MLVFTLVSKFAFACVLELKAHPLSATTGTWTSMPLVRVFGRNTILPCMHSGNSLSVLFQPVSREDVTHCLNQILISPGF